LINRENKMKKNILSKIHKIIAEHANELKLLSKNVHENPELAFKEVKACEWQVDLLRDWGFNVQVPFAGMKTAFKATYGKGNPVFCYMSEYDALPGLGHGCGHNLICSAALGAGLAASRILEAGKIRGSVIVMGTPAEEHRGGKVKIVSKRGLQGIDACMMAHPSFRTTPDTGSTAIQRVRVIFYGRSAHAATAPELGRNALDAVMLLFHGTNAWRQHLPEDSRLHGIVDDGGVKPNIVPRRASCDFFLRSPHDSVLSSMIRRFKKIAEGAALMTNTRYRVVMSETSYMSRRPNQPLNRAFLESAKAVGLKPVIPKIPARGSSDFGNVSHKIPGVHIYFGIAKKEIPGHSPALCRAAGSAYGQKQMLRTAEVMAYAGYRYFTEAGFRKSIKRDFQTA
jgi:amidohydrolase